jgi:hypothetical protein
MIDANKDLLNSMIQRSLYCVWIKSNDAADAPLVCIWIDPRMHAFASVGDENDAHATIAAEDPQEIVDDPDLTLVYNVASL